MTKVKYLPYPPLGKVEFYCENCWVVATIPSYYPEACTVRVFHRCRKTKRDKELLRR